MGSKTHHPHEQPSVEQDKGGDRAKAPESIREFASRMSTENINGSLQGSRDAATAAAYMKQHGFPDLTIIGADDKSHTVTAKDQDGHFWRVKDGARKVDPLIKTDAEPKPWAKHDPINQGAGNVDGLPTRSDKSSPQGKKPQEGWGDKFDRMHGFNHDQHGRDHTKAAGAAGGAGGRIASQPGDAAKPTEGGPAKGDNPTWNQPPTKLNGEQCKEPSNRGGIPTLPYGRNTPGCEVTPLDKAAPHLKDHYEHAKESLVHIRTNVKAGGVRDSMSGSGVVMGHGNDVTYVATVNHNTTDHNEDPSMKTEEGRKIYRDGPIRVQMSDGKHYDARRATLKGEDGTDRSVLIVHTGADTGKYKAPEFADEPNYKGKGFSVGFPGDAKSPYAAPYQARGDGKGNPRDGEPKNITKNEGHSQPGMSGGPMYNERGQVYALDDANDDRRPFKGMFGIPFGRQEVERLKKNLPESW